MYFVVFCWPSSLVIVSGACGMHVCNFQYSTILNFTWSEISENIKHMLVIYNHNFSSLLLSLFAKMHHFNCSDGTAFKCKLTSLSWLFALTLWPLTRLAMCRQEVMVKLEPGDLYFANYKNKVKIFVSRMMCRSQHKLNSHLTGVTSRVTGVDRVLISMKIRNLCLLFSCKMQIYSFPKSHCVTVSLTSVLFQV